MGCSRRKDRGEETILYRCDNWLITEYEAEPGQAWLKWCPPLEEEVVYPPFVYGPDKRPVNFSGFLRLPKTHVQNVVEFYDMTSLQ